MAGFSDRADAPVEVEVVPHPAFMVIFDLAISRSSSTTVLAGNSEAASPPDSRHRLARKDED